MEAIYIVGPFRKSTYSVVSQRSNFPDRLAGWLTNCLQPYWDMPGARLANFSSRTSGGQQEIRAAKRREKVWPIVRALNSNIIFQRQKGLSAR